MATKIRPIVFRINEPEGFVMNASNAIDITGNGTGMYVTWEGPAYPNGYDGNGKHYVLVNNNPNSDLYTDFGLMYANDVGNGGPQAILPAAMSIIGQSEGTMSANQAGTASGYGKYFCFLLKKSGAGITQADAEAYIANVSITILDP